MESYIFIERRCNYANFYGHFWTSNRYSLIRFDFTDNREKSHRSTTVSVDELVLTSLELLLPGMNDTVICVCKRIWYSSFSVPLASSVRGRQPLSLACQSIGHWYAYDLSRDWSELTMPVDSPDFADDRHSSISLMVNSRTYHFFLVFWLLFHS